MKKKKSSALKRTGSVRPPVDDVFPVVVEEKAESTSNPIFRYIQYILIGLSTISILIFLLKTFLVEPPKKAIVQPNRAYTKESSVRPPQNQLPKSTPTADTVKPKASKTPTNNDTLFSSKANEAAPLPPKVPIIKSRNRRKTKLSDQEINRIIGEHDPPPSRFTEEEAISYDLAPISSTHPWPCTNEDSCPGTFLCNFATGKCEPRIWHKKVLSPEDPPELPQISTISPLNVSPGDMLILDGTMLYKNIHDKQLIWRKGDWTLLENMVSIMQVSIGDYVVPMENIIASDEDRMVILVNSQMSGILKLTDREFGYIAKYPHAVVNKPGPRLINKCGEKNPPKSGIPGDAPSLPGPYAAGYVDVHWPDPYTRVYYPALCGGLRTPPAAGTFPVVLVLHGNGANHINYEYLTHFLSSWGFLVVVPAEIEVESIKKAMLVALDAPESMWSPLAGHSAGGKAFVITHSRGGERVEKLISSSAGKRIKAIVNMTPFRPFKKLSVPSMYFAASGDRQAASDFVYLQWLKQDSPTYFLYLYGGNHSQFTDVRHWEKYDTQDAIPFMKRKRQHSIIKAYVLAFLQDFLKGPKPFQHLLEGVDKPYEVVFESR